MRAARLVRIVLILQSRGKRTCAALSDELEVTRRTILRDLDALSAAGIPVIAEGGHGGGVSLDESYRAGLTGLDERELRALLIGADATLAGDLGMSEAFHLGRLKLQAARAKRFESAIEIFQRRVFIDSSWWWRDETSGLFLESLREAVFADEVIDAEYEHYDRRSSKARIAPYALVAKSGLWYLIGRREGNLRSYRVSRFHSVRRTGQHFARDDAFDVREWWPANQKRFAAEFSSFRFTLALPEESLHVVRRIAPGRIQSLTRHTKRAGWLIAEIAVDSSLYAELIVLALGKDCRILEPASLTKAVAARARAALAAVVEAKSPMPRTA
jgi:predicted DNA-binding transcriptional regulator YafY